MSPTCFMDMLPFPCTTPWVLKTLPTVWDILVSPLVSSPLLPFPNSWRLLISVSWRTLLLLMKLSLKISKTLKAEESSSTLGPTSSILVSSTSRTSSKLKMVIASLSPTLLVPLVILRLLCCLTATLCLFWLLLSSIPMLRSILKIFTWVTYLCLTSLKESSNTLSSLKVPRFTTTLVMFKNWKTIWPTLSPLSSFQCPDSTTDSTTWSTNNSKSKLVSRSSSSTWV